MFLLRIILFAMGLFFLSVESVNLGLCKDCGCITQECDYPKTAAECEECRKSVNAVRTSMDDGHCWVLIGATTEGNCALRTFSKLLGCSGFSGYSHYGGSNKNCWAKWRPSSGRKRREVSEFWNRDTL
ncbi:hypothetical protein Bhyg_09006 [Pseudolycoriella hygida]|uniref:Uncharacterized protein n=1 Tax=Pseudolycoriella hygida TaxID=35572 RepID=A0A9Q0S5H4_9DIPT|nr:hypothetical protein Bhyg_09006 [Pseudolycoriella hygida]